VKARRAAPDARRSTRTLTQGALLEPARAILRRYGLHPRKALGQNFLVDEAVLDAVVAAAELAPDALAVEVGPGLGFLTERLAAVAGRVLAIELDEALGRVVEDRFGTLGKVTVRHANVLHTDLGADIGPEQPFTVVANIPYYITAPILRLFLEGPRRPEAIVLMVQREVAERLAAKPGKMSLLSLSAQTYATPEIVRLVPATAFYPPPEVQSAIIRLRRRSQPAFSAELNPLVFTAARAAFHDRRKQIHNSLTIGLTYLGPDRIDTALSEAGVERTRRAETLAVEEWGSLARALQRQGMTTTGALGSAFDGEDNQEGS